MSSSKKRRNKRNKNKRGNGSASTQIRPPGNPKKKKINWKRKKMAAGRQDEILSFAALWLVVWSVFFPIFQISKQLQWENRI